MHWRKIFGCFGFPVFRSFRSFDVLNWTEIKQEFWKSKILWNCSKNFHETQVRDPCPKITENSRNHDKNSGPNTHSKHTKISTIWPKIFGSIFGHPEFRFPIPERKKTGHFGPKFLFCTDFVLYGKSNRKPKILPKYIASAYNDELTSVLNWTLLCSIILQKNCLKIRFG